MKRLFQLLFVAVWCLTQQAAAQAPASISLPGKARDAVVSDDGATVYVAIQASRELLKINTADGAVTGRAQLEREANALALSSDGETLAALSTAGQNVTLLGAANMLPIAVVAAGDGAKAITRVPGGGFAIANSFSDSVTLIASGVVEHPVTIEGVASVPNGVAASGVYLGVTTRVPAALLLFANGVKQSGSVALPDAPTALASLGNGRFAVATKSELLLVDPSSQTITSKKAIANLSDLASAGSRVVALSAQGIQVFDESLNEVSASALVSPANGAAAGPGMVVLLSTASPQLDIVASTQVEAPTVAAIEASPAVETPVVEAPPAPAQPEPAPTPTTPPAENEVEAETVIEKSAEQPAATPAPEPQPEPAPVEAPAPVEEPAPTEPAPVEMPAEPAQEAPAPVYVEPTTVEATPETPAPAPEATAAEQPADAPKSNTPVRRVPLGGFETGAPSPKANRPLPYPSIGVSEKSLGEGITEEIRKQPDTTGGFIAPDWNNPWVLRNADEATGMPGEDNFELRGNVDIGLKVSELNIKTDYLSYNKNSGELRAEGNVDLTQGLSKLAADTFYYTIPLELPEEEQPSPLLATANEQEKQRVSSGMIETTNVDIVEPGREAHADYFRYDFAEQTGEAENFRGRWNSLYFGGQKVRVLGPASIDGEDVWVTTCDHDPPHYKIRMKKASVGEDGLVRGSSAQFELGESKTPLYWPKFRLGGGGGSAAGFDFDSGRRAVIGYYVNMGQTFSVTKELDLGVRLYPTSSAGVGFGVEGQYDYMNKPTSPLFRSQGEFRSLYTTEDRGYYEAYHRQEITKDVVLLAQTEQWGDEDFYKDFYYELYRNRTEPRTFANLTYTQPTYLATATVRKRTNSNMADTERLPEATFSLLERPLAENIYFSFDTIDGYNVRKPSDVDAVRSVNVARLTYDWNVTEAINLMPFYEAEVSWYSDTPDNEDSNTRFSNTVGATLQTRFHKVYPGALGFSGFKHVVVPSFTYSYRPEPTMDLEDTPRFDALDNVYGRSRFETKLSNVIFGKDAETEEVWQVARLTLYQGTDFWNELRKSDDYEVEFDIRPRPWWGFQAAGEHHSISDDGSIDEPFFIQRSLIQLYEEVTNDTVDSETALRYNARYGDYDRVLSYLYYDDRQSGGKFNARLGYAYSATQQNVFNKEILYGAGYQIGEKWGIGFEHRYDFERDELTRQEYEIRRNLHCWEAALNFREREEGWDLSFQLNLVAFPGAKVKF